MELLTVLAILGILASTAFPLAEMVSRRQKEQDLRHSLRQLRDAIDQYKKAVDDGRVERKLGQTGYPPTLGVLVDGVRDLRDAEGRKIFFLRRIPTDPFAREGIQGAASWGLRSYASPPEDPKPGDDVFDVFSLSPLVGLDGVPYRRW